MYATDQFEADQFEADDDDGPEQRSQSTAQSWFDKIVRISVLDDWGYLYDGNRNRTSRILGRSSLGRGTYDRPKLVDH